MARNDSESSPLMDILTWYNDNRIHVPLVTCICVLGLCSHMLIILVLTRKKVFNPTNMLMISLSVCQLLLLIGFLVFVNLVKLQDVDCKPRFWSYGWVFSTLFFTDFNVAAHACEVFHVVSLSIVRYISIVVGQRSRQSWFTVRRALFNIILIYSVVPPFCGLVFAGSTIKETTAGESRYWCRKDRDLGVDLNSTSYKIGQRFNENSSVMRSLIFWYYGIGFKLLPCCFVSIMSVLLAIKLRELDKRAKLIKRKNKRKYNRTSYLILAVMALFVVVEMPQSILNIYVSRDQSFIKIYSRLQDIFEMLTVLYGSINFIIFCLMSGPFRETFIKLLRRAVNDMLGKPDLIRRLSSRTRTGSKRRSSYMFTEQDRSYILPSPSPKQNSEEILENMFFSNGHATESTPMRFRTNSDRSERNIDELERDSLLRPSGAVTSVVSTV